MMNNSNIATRPYTGITSDCCSAVRPVKDLRLGFERGKTNVYSYSYMSDSLKMTVVPDLFLTENILRQHSASDKKKKAGSVFNYLQESEKLFTA